MSTWVTGGNLHCDEENLSLFFKLSVRVFIPSFIGSTAPHTKSRRRREAGGINPGTGLALGASASCSISDASRGNKSFESWCSVLSVHWCLTHQTVASSAFGLLLSPRPEHMDSARPLKHVEMFFMSAVDQSFLVCRFVPLSLPGRGRQTSESGLWAAAET